MSRFLTIFVLVIAVSVTWTWLMREPMRWAVYYADELPYADFAEYDIVVFDSDGYPAFAAEKHEGQVVLGYLSTAEAEEYRPYYNDIAALDVFVGPSDLWDGHHFIDIRDVRWREYFVNTLVPQVLAKGFDGIMLDTIDSALALEENDPETFAGMHDAAAALLRALREAHPDALLMLNRGFSLPQETFADVDYVLAESIRVEYDFDAHTSALFADEIYNAYVALLTAAQKAHPHLTVVTLDYWDMGPEGADGVRRLYAEQRSHGFVPYVSTVGLDHLYGEPR